ncbi:FMN-dependent NADH-azoreductase [Saccharospirillum sp. MSK14-1]|uniref:FMN-dependent NADH-azoreductase n=1 Tax=Saccharospirillum sp. MSK14-1 TaxID=1897632 RepID=UPI000D3540C6|nr:FMN-dependent NADH-azoreductase [Saccharospirillum sp. MSK14-1]PTY37985.1 FMN-dependent NADH-azoreductase [Saccharospirillum sp. MSK14-1]
MNILHLDSSILGDQSVSRQLSRQVVERLRQQHEAAQVTYRDLVANAIPHLDMASLSAGQVPADQRNTDQSAQFELTETLLNELFSADVIVIGLPFYNFGMPSQLKAWIDRIAQSGRTFRYTENGPEGLVTGKKVILASSRGGVYSQGPASAMEHQESHLTSVFGLLGLSDVVTVRAEGVNMGDDFKNQALAAAGEQIDRLTVAA